MVGDCWVDGVLVFTDEAGAAVVVSAVGAGEAGVLGASGGGGSGCCGAASCIAGAIGLTGFNGLLMFVTLVGLFMHEFIVSTQGDITGGLYGVGQVVVCCSVIVPTNPC